MRNPKSKFKKTKREREKMAEADKSVDKTKDYSITNLITDGKNPRGIPTAKFIENVEEFLLDTSVEAALGSLNELYSKYKYMETSFERSKAVYKSKVPEINQTLELIGMMKRKKDGDDENSEMVANYSLCDTIFSQAKLDIDGGKVCLWIGASTMVEYTYEEAIELLTTQIQQSHAKIQELDEDLFHLRGNSITVEVNMARLFNYSVKLKKEREAAALTAGK
jgi:prefoldin subunit 5